MTSLLKTLIDLSVLGSLITMLILLVLKVVNKHLKETVKYCLVLFAMMTLIIPFNKVLPETHVNISPKQQAILKTLPVPIIQETVDPKPLDSISKPLVKDTQREFSVVDFYGIVLLLLVIRYAIQYRKFTQEIKGNLITMNNPSAREIQALVGDDVHLVFTKQATSPFVFGIMRQSIVIPVAMMTQSQLPLIIQHELVHYKRHDVLIKTVLNVIHMIHWFNPFMFIFKKKAYQYMETSCDEKVTDHLSHTAKVDYAHLIIEVLDGYNVQGSAITTGFSTKQNKIKNRIEAFMNPKNLNKIKKYSIVSLVLLMTVSIGFLSKNKVVASEPKLKAASVSAQTTIKPEQPVAQVDATVAPVTVAEDTPSEEPVQEKQEAEVPPTEEPEPIEQAFYYPVINGEIAFAWEEYHGHNATDFRYNNGEGTGSGPVYAIGKGVVIRNSYVENGWGNYIMIEHENGYISTYAHLEDVGAAVGTIVDENTQVGITGRTGMTVETMVRLEIRDSNNKHFDPETILNPR